MATAGLALAVVTPAFADKPADKKESKAPAEMPAQAQNDHGNANGPKEHGKNAAPQEAPAEAPAPAAAPAPAGEEPVGDGGGRAAKPAKAPKQSQASSPESSGRKVTICHATGSTKNPYVRITVSVNSTTGNGHGLHEDDLIPAPAAGCPAPADGGGDPGGGGSGGGGSGGGGSGGGGGTDKDPPAGPKSPPNDQGGVGAGTNAPVVQGSLPFTGLSAGWIALLGLALLGAGLALRYGWSRGRTRGLKT